jgi:hypothetical protein
MKKIILFVVAMMSTASVISQTSLFPILSIETNKSWRTVKNESRFNYPAVSTTYYNDVNGNKTINNHVYFSYTNYVMSEFNLWDNKTHLFREENGRLYYKENEQSDEFVVLDFNLKVGDTFDNKLGNLLQVVDVSDTIISGSYFDYSDENSEDVICIDFKTTRKVIRLKDVSNSKIEDVWIEGIGSLRFGIIPTKLQEEDEPILASVYDDKKLYIFKNDIGDIRVAESTREHNQLPSGVEQKLELELKDGVLQIIGYIQLRQDGPQGIACQIKENDIYIEKITHSLYGTSRIGFFYIDITIPNLSDDHYNVHFAPTHNRYKEDVFYVKDVATNINNITKNTADSAIYDLTGRRLNGKPERGIYIQGGKKYIAK